MPSNLNGITSEALKREHLSVLRNPIIADVFHRTGLIEKWGRGTNRVAEMCEVAGGAVVTFRVPVAGPESRPESRPESQPESRPEWGGLEERVLMALKRAPMSKSELALAVGQKGVSGQLKKTVSSLLRRGAIELTIPDKLGSRLQKYRLTAAGQAALSKARGR